MTSRSIPVLPRRPISRRRLIGAASVGRVLAATHLALPALARGVQEADAWLTADDISGMPDTTIRYWYYESPERVALGEQQVAQFQELFPNITVDARTAPPDVDNEQLLAFIRAGTNSHVHQTVN